jgi:hypothetical protein
LKAKRDGIRNWISEPETMERMETEKQQTIKKEKGELRNVKRMKYRCPSTDTKQ